MKKYSLILLKKTIGLFINLLHCVLPTQAVRLTYYFFSTPNADKLEALKLPEILNNAEKEIIKFEDYSIQSYIWKGNNNKILLAHGWESNASRWENLLVKLRKTGSTIIAIDAPAHGLSNSLEFSVPLYSRFIYELCKIHQPKAIVAHSMGAFATSHYQNYYKPKHLRKLVLLGSPSSLAIIIQNFTKSLGLKSKILNNYKAFLENKFSITIETFSTEDFMKNCKIDGLLIHDKDDNIVAFSEATKIASAWQNVQFIKTKNLGHSMHDDDLYNKICTFLSEE